MPLMLYPVCWRGRDDCEPIHCIDAAPSDATEEQVMNFDYKPSSFVCSGCVNPEARSVQQDAYRLCFKNHATDEMSDNDMQDLSSVVSVASAALLLDSVRKVASGTVEIPAAQAKADE